LYVEIWYNGKPGLNSWAALFLTDIEICLNITIPKYNMHFVRYKVTNTSEI